ncbi:MAG: tripartite tricarboxylate transporter substrate-binding protein, partial [Betaproteobacteria bacterium]|nr:tripartite tricarboxylate transporter substrate-binding protein [Betaproteobacteria bacterium]
MKSTGYCISLVVAGLLALPVAAQSYPSKPVRMIIPFSAGGAADVPGRIVMQKLGEALKQQVIVENRPGAGSTIG